MNIPSLPTDSLYKFLAIAGISVIVISVYFGFKVEIQYSQDVIEFNGKIEEFKTEQSFLDVQMLDIKRKLRKLCTNCNCECFDKNGNIQVLPNFSSKENSDLYNQRKEIDDLLDKYSEKSDLVIKSGQHIATQKKLLSNSEKYTDEFTQMFIFGIIIGIVMTIIGFVLWYFKIQIYQDKILKHEASKLTEKENTKPS